MALVFGAIAMAVGVAAGAFGAHALKQTLDAQMLAVWETAVRYHLVHGLALVALGLFERATNRSFPGVAPALIAGIVLFSGSLYALALSSVRWLGAITPFGGVAFIGGWSLLAHYALKR